MRDVWVLGMLIGGGCAKNTTPAPAAASAPAAQASEPASTPESSIRAAFQAYRQAILSGDGAGVASLVDSPILAHYESLVKDALSLPRQQLFESSVSDFMLVVLLRTRKSRAELESLQGTVFEQLAVDPSFVDPGLAQAIPQLSDVRIVDQTHAIASIPMSPDDYVMPFVREADGWKMDMTATLATAMADGGDEPLFPDTDKGRRGLLFALNMARSMHGGDPLDADTLEAVLEGPLE